MEFGSESKQHIKSLASEVLNAFECFRENLD